MITIPGLELEDEIGRGAHSVVYRARRGARRFAVKIHRAGGARAADGAARRFWREASMLACLRHPALPEIVDVGEVEGTPYLVRELVEGQTLAERIATGPCPAEQVVAIGRALGGALVEVHRHGLVHRDVKPANVMVDDEGGFKLIDFGFATFARITDSHDMVGTFLYASPEQTGMLKRPVDGRSDLYALGVTLFEAATGRPPFESSDVGDLIRQHAVAPPPELARLNPDIPPALCRVIDKLLAKDPDDRYQTAEGLVADLANLPALGDALRAGDTTLGSRDELSDPAHLMPLIGRDAELKALLARWNEALRGHGSSLVLEGEPGSGKSRLLTELVAAARAGGGLVLSGRCSPSAAVPFAPIANAVDGHLRALSLLPAHERRRGLQRVREAAAEHAPLLKRLSPGLASLFRDLEEEPADSDSHARFLEACASFLRHLADGHAGAVLVLDDVQWLDDASYSVLVRLGASIGESRLVVACTARRERGSGGSEAASRLVEEVGATRLRLLPLDHLAIAELVRRHLGNMEVDEDVIRTIATRAGGSPFAVGEYVRAMLDAGQLRPSWGTWHLDTAGLESLDLPTDVVELVLRRVALLPSAAHGILETAALMGSRFSIGQLPAITGSEASEVNAAVTEATRAHLIERVGKAGGGTYLFIHEAVREAFVDQMSPGEQRDGHQRIAEALYELDAEGPEQVFALARHFALGHAEDHPDQVCETSVAAGQAAMANFALDEAHRHLQRARAAREDAGRAPDLRLQELLADVCARTGRVSAAVEHLDVALAHTTDPLRRAAVRAELAEVHFWGHFDTQKAFEQVEAGMADLKVRYVRFAPIAVCVALWYWMLARLFGRFKLGFGGVRGEKRRRLQILERFHVIAGMVGYFDVRPMLLTQMVSRSLWTSHRLGPSQELVACYNNHAVLYGVLGRRKAADRFTERAVALSESMSDRRLRARSLLYGSIAHHLLGESLEAERAVRQYLRADARWVDAWDYLSACGDLSWNLLMRGYFREAWDWLDRGFDRARVLTAGKGEHGIMRYPSIHWAASILAVIGRTGEAARFLKRGQEILAEAPDERYHKAAFWSQSLLLHLEQGELGRPVEEAIERFESLRLSAFATPLYLRDFYVYKAYARLAQALAAAPHDRKDAVRALGRAVRQLKRVAYSRVLKAHYHTARGALLRLRGRDRRAESALDEAERFARATDNRWARYEIARERARLLAARGNPQAARLESELALSLAVEHGWVARAQTMREELRTTKGLPAGLSSSARPTLGSHPSTVEADAVALKLKRYLDALLSVSLASSSELQPDQLARSALDEIVRLLGAERAFLFLVVPGSEELYAAAGRNMNGQDLLDLRGFSTTVVEHVRTSRRALVVSGTDEGFVLGSESAVLHDLRSIIAAPLMIRDRMVGVVYLDSRVARGIFTEDDVEILLAIANHIAIALETARAAQLELHVYAEREQRRLAETLRNLSNALNSTLELREVLGRLLECLAQIVPYDSATVVMIEDGMFQVVAGIGHPDTRQVRRVRLPVADDALFSEISRTRRPIVLEDAQRDHRFHGHGSTGYVRGWIGVPLLMGDEVIGMLTVDSKTPGAYSQHDAEMAFTFAGQAVIALENARLFGEVQRLAVTDELTGSSNRRSFYELAEREFRRAKRYRRPVSAIMLDIDNFKRVNDTHGHLVGDAVLRELARRCHDTVREVDIFGRYGGEEFAVILPDTELDEAKHTLAERLRLAVSDRPFDTPGGPIDVTVSLGVAEVSADIPNLAALLDRADTALYAAKRAGKNRVESA